MALIPGIDYVKREEPTVSSTVLRIKYVAVWTTKFSMWAMYMGDKRHPPLVTSSICVVVARNYNGFLLARHAINIA